MHAIKHIRKTLFKVTQAEMAVIAGTTQASVSRWEKGQSDPSLDELARIRSEALRRQIDWDDRIFFETAPEESAA